MYINSRPSTGPDEEQSCLGIKSDYNVPQSVKLVVMSATHTTTVNTNNSYPPMYLRCMDVNRKEIMVAYNTLCHHKSLFGPVPETRPQNLCNNSNFT